MPRQPVSTRSELPRMLIIGVHAPYNKIANIDSYFEEFVNLVKANDCAYEQAIFIRLREIDTATFFTKGKLEEIGKLCEEKKIAQVVISEPLTPVQERNLADVLHVQIFDRTRLILDIFEKQANSVEAKTQVTIAQLQFSKTRLAGRGMYMAQQSGLIGGRGLGETAKERETRHIEKQIHKFQQNLAKQMQTRETQRKRRLVTGIPLISLVGYTNAGKSTIMNRLTHSDVLAKDQLFATLDTTSRELFVNSKKKGILIDTVGFIQLLPPTLIEAFKSTLSELKYADLLLHVIDASDPNWQQHVAVVHEILNDLEVEAQMLYVFNKVDKVENPLALDMQLHKYEPHVVINALDKKGLKPLVEFLAEWEPPRILERRKQAESD
jgi:GTPase